MYNFENFQLVSKLLANFAKLFRKESGDKFTADFSSS